MVKRIFIKFMGGFLLLLAWTLFNKYFDLGFMSLSQNVYAENYAIAPVNSKYALQNGTIANQSITTFTFNNLPGTTFYGYTGTASGGYWSYAQYGINLSNLTKKGYYNIDYLFYNNWQGNLLEQYTFSVFTNGAFTTCTGNDSNANLGSNVIVKNIISVKCYDVYIDSSQSDALFVNIYPNNAKSFMDTIGITKATFSYLPINDQTGILEQQERTNDLIEDDSIDDNKTSSDINTMNSKIASNNAITQLLTLPITLYQSILNSANGSCSSISLGSLYNHSLNLPCINLQNLLGSTLYGIIDILISGLFILSFRKKMVDIFNHMTSLNDRGNELE